MVHVKLGDCMKIFVVEDDDRVANFLDKALRAENYTTIRCTTIKEFLEFLELKQNIDLAIFDRMIGRDDSLIHLSKFKSIYENVPVIFLSALNSPEEKAVALDKGADDYMGKPYSFQELSSRIRALIRRYEVSSNLNSGGKGTPFLQLGNTILDPLAQTVRYNGAKIDFSAKELKLLATFLKHPGQVYSKYQLLDIAWDIQLDLESNVVETTIRNIRRKLEMAGVDIQIVGRRHMGYWIEKKDLSNNI